MNLGLFGIPSSLKKVLSFFIERRNSTGVNTVTPIHQIQATGPETNIGIAITPKGNGAITAQIPDGTTAGGNARGANAVDLQGARTAATQVASGAGSFVAGGSSNTASGAGSVVAGGSGNTASGTNSAVLGGDGNNASGIRSVIAGGNGNIASTGNCTVSGGVSNTASGIRATVSGGGSNTASDEFATVSGGAGNIASARRSTVSGGSGNTASGFNSTIPGGAAATTNGIQGQVAFGHNSDLLGGYQTTLTGLRQVTTGTTATRATADGATPATANQLTLRNNSVFIVEGSVVAYDITTLDAASFSISALIKRGAAAANTSLVGTPVISRDFNDTAAANWMVAVSADTTNGALAVTVTGAGANQIRWMVELYTQETGV